MPHDPWREPESGTDGSRQDPERAPEGATDAAPEQKPAPAPDQVEAEKEDGAREKVAGASAFEAGKARHPNAKKPKPDPPTHQPDGTPLPTDRAICRARKKNGRYCLGVPMANGRCRLHGGLSPPPGPDHPNWRHGGRSKLFRLHRNTAFAQRVRHALEHPHLRRTDEDLAQSTARLQMLLDRIGTPESDAAWKAANEAMEALLATLSKGSIDPERMMAQVRTIRDVLQRGVGEHHQFREMMEVRRERVQLIQADAAIQQTAGAWAPVAEAQMMVQALVADLRLEGVSEDVLRRVWRRWSQRLGEGPDGGPAAPAAGAG